MVVVSLLTVAKPRHLKDAVPLQAQLLYESFLFLSVGLEFAKSLALELGLTPLLLAVVEEGWKKINENDEKLVGRFTVR